jgi:hypothetical protein
MSGGLTVTVAFGPTLEDVVLQALSGARRPARTAVCPVCGGAMRRWTSPEAADADGPGGDLVCGECDSALIEPAPSQEQLRLVS